MPLIQLNILHSHIVLSESREIKTWASRAICMSHERADGMQLRLALKVTLEIDEEKNYFHKFSRAVKGKLVN